MNRAVVAARAAQNRTSATCSTGRPGTNLLARTLTEVERAVPAHRGRKSPRLTATQKDSTGRSSAWARSPYYWTNPGWSA